MCIARILVGMRDWCMSCVGQKSGGHAGPRTCACTHKHAHVHFTCHRQITNADCYSHNHAACLHFFIFYFFFEGKVFTDKPRLTRTAPGRHTGVAGR